MGEAGGDEIDPQDLWRMVQDAASSGAVGIVITVDDHPEGPRPAYVNDILLEATGYSREEFLRIPSFRTVPPEEVPALEARRLRRLAGEPLSPRFETRMLAKDGRRIPVDVGLGRSTWKGRPVTVAFIRDLSEGKEVMTRLVNLETIYGATIDGLLFVDRDMNLVSANRRFAEIFGLTSDEVLRLPKEVVRARARARYRDPRVFDDGLRVYEPANWSRVFDDEIELVGDPPLIVHEHSEPIFDKGGEYVGRVWTYRDVTRERELARELAKRSRELARYAETLEAEVEKRSVKLAEAQKMAALGQLIAGVAHEVNNPLAFVKSNTEILAEAWTEILANDAVRRCLADDNADPAAAVGWLRDSGNARFVSEDLPTLLEMNLKGLGRIHGIVQRLREFARPYPLEKTPTDLNGLLADTARMFHAQFSDRIEMVTDFEEIPPVPCDPGKLGQVVMNLLVNAAQAIEGKGRVRLSTRAEGGRAVVRVEDDGRGIAPEHLPRIFDPFFTTKEVGGLGLGLSITYGIVKEHGGDIGVSSAPGRGTTFSVTLPFHVGGQAVHG